MDSKEWTTAGERILIALQWIAERDTHNRAEVFKDTLDSPSGILQGCAERPFLNPAVVPFLSWEHQVICWVASHFDPDFTYKEHDTDDPDDRDPEDKDK